VVAGSKEGEQQQQLMLALLCAGMFDRGMLLDCARAFAPEWMSWMEAVM
jgi:hypothetical protein